MLSKQEFLDKLKARLSALPKEEAAERLNFYSEMIDDRKEEGLSEEEAVAAVGDADEIAEQIIADIPLTKIIKEKITTKRRLKGWEIAILAIGSPIWFSLACAAFAVVISIYVSVWSVIISLWAVFASLVGCAFGGVVAGVGFALSGNGLIGIATIGAGIFCVGLTVFTLLGCKTATKGTILLTKMTVLSIKNRFAKKEEA